MVAKKSGKSLEMTTPKNKGQNAPKKTPKRGKKGKKMEAVQEVKTRIPRELYSALRAIAQRNRRSIAAELAFAIEHYERSDKEWTEKNAETKKP